MRFVLLHSPLLGPLTWRGVAQELASRGFQAEAPAWASLGAVGGDAYAALANEMARTIERSGAEPALLVAHSGAGALVPALMDACSVPVAGVILVDAILPHPGQSWMDTAPADLRHELTIGAVDGMLPSWDGWWPPGALERLVPDHLLRTALLEELRPLPLAYFEAAAPDQDLADRVAYLQLSGAYEDQAQSARSRGWRCRRAQMNHLSPLTAPREVAALVQGLGSELLAQAHG